MIVKNDDWLKRCTGCGVCANVCSQHAIEMKEGYHTFLYPETDEKLCLNCGACERVCPIMGYDSDNDSALMATEGKYDIAIVGIPTVENFGGALTYFALYEVLEELGYSCVFVERTLDSKHPAGQINRIYKNSPYRDEILLNRIRHRKDLENYGNIADIYLVGSDQLFHNNLMTNFSDFALLDWVDDSKVKIAYAASFGHDKFTGTRDKWAFMSYYMKKFDAFSVREKSGVQLSRQFGVEARQVMDPVFLCPKEVYCKLAESSDVDFPSKYTGAYILDPDAEKEKIIKCIEKYMDMETTVYSEFICNDASIKKRWNIREGKIEDRLKNIMECRFFVADSFHGICFAIIFKKNFVAIVNRKRGETRFVNLLETVGLSDRMIYSTDENKIQTICGKAIDYDEVDKKLYAEVVKSKNWLVEKLETQYNKSFSCEDILIRYLKKQLDGVRENFTTIFQLMGISFYSKEDIIEYVTEIEREKNNLLIIIAAKDTPGMSIGTKINDSLHRLGITQNLSDAHWCGYASVIYRGVNIFENRLYEEKVVYAGNVEDININIVSAPLHAGNKAGIILNEIDYSMNMRGLNFVIYDFRYRKVVDSVCFDTHDFRIPCTRRKKS